MTVTMLLKLSPIQCSVLDVHIREPCLETAGRKMIKFWYVLIYGWQRAVRDTPKRSCDSTRYQNYWDLITTAGQVRTRANSTGSGFWTTFSKFTWELVFGHIYHHISYIYIHTVEVNWENGGDKLSLFEQVKLDVACLVWRSWVKQLRFRVTRCSCPSVNFVFA